MVDGHHRERDTHALAVKKRTGSDSTIEVHCPVCGTGATLGTHGPGNELWWRCEGIEGAKRHVWKPSALTGGVAPGEGMLRSERGEADPLQ
jgi:hypothetical protein